MYSDFQDMALIDGRVREVRVGSVKVSRKTGPRKVKPHKDKMSRADVIKSAIFGLADGTCATITHPAVVPARRSE